VGSLVQDFRYAVRGMAKSPGLTAMVVLILAVGIGANTGSFSVVSAILLHPFSLRSPDRTVAVWETMPQQSQQHIGAAPANFLDWHEENKGFAFLAARRAWNANLSAPGIAERLEGYQVTADFFPLLGIASQYGRTILSSDFEPGHASVVVLSFGFWQEHLGADSGIIGKNLLLNGRKFMVVGVMPADFDFPVGAQAWAPLDFTVSEQAERTDHALQVLGLLKPGVTATQAQAGLEIISARLARQYPESNAGHGVRVVRLLDDLTENVRQLLPLVWGSAAFVLLLACANIANLLLARTTGRQKEVGVRLALGASRWRIARQLLVESGMLALLGSLMGLLLAYGGLALVRRTTPANIMQHVLGAKHMQLDWTVLAFTLVATLLTGVLIGLAPALQASRPDLTEILKEGARSGGSSPSRNRLRRLLVIFEVALALLLLVGAGLMVKGFRNLANIPMGFDRRQVLTFRIGLAESKYDGADRVREFYRQLVQRLEILPGVESAAAVTSLPLGGSWSRTLYTAEGQPRLMPGEMRLAVKQCVMPGFFAALRVPLLEGRFLTAQDGRDSPQVVVISRSMAQLLWPGQDAIGKRIKFGPEEKPEQQMDPWRTVVGVVGDIRQVPIPQEPDLTAYFPFSQLPQSSSAVVVRTSGDPLALAASARAVVVSLDAEQAPYYTQTLEQLISEALGGLSFAARMMVTFGVLALVLAALGTYALMAYSVAQRTHEIGVRMTLGAQRADVLGLVVGDGMKLAVAGIAVGICCAVAVSRALLSLVFGIIRMDALTLTACAILLASASALAAYLPARRAVKVDPLVALRHE
jgi:putative ABC transport system permease protein